MDDARFRLTDAQLQHHAAYGFAPLGAAAVPALGDLLKDEDGAVRARAADALGIIHGGAERAASAR